MECYSDLVAQITADSLTLSGAGVTSACGMSYVVTRSALPAFDNCPEHVYNYLDGNGQLWYEASTVLRIIRSTMRAQRSTTARLNATVECYSDLVAQITADSLTLSGAGVTSACGMSYVVTRSALTCL